MGQRQITTDELLTILSLPRTLLAQSGYTYWARLQTYLQCRFMRLITLLC